MRQKVTSYKQTRFSKNWFLVCCNSKYRLWLILETAMSVHILFLWQFSVRVHVWHVVYMSELFSSVLVKVMFRVIKVSSQRWVSIFFSKREWINFEALTLWDLLEKKIDLADVIFLAYGKGFIFNFLPFFFVCCVCIFSLKLFPLVFFISHAFYYR